LISYAWQCPKFSVARSNGLFQTGGLLSNRIGRRVITSGFAEHVISNRALSARREAATARRGRWRPSPRSLLLKIAEHADSTLSPDVAASDMESSVLADGPADSVRYPMHAFGGVPFDSFTPAVKISTAPEYVGNRLRADDVFVWTYPKAGTSVR